MLRNVSDFCEGAMPPHVRKQSQDMTRLVERLATNHPFVFYYAMLGLVALVVAIPGLFFLLSQYLYGGPPPWWPW